MPVTETGLQTGDGLPCHAAPGLLEARRTQAFDTEADSERVHVASVPISGGDITITAMKIG